MLIKQCFREMFLLVHPQAVAPLKIGGQVVPNRVAFSVLAFIFVYFMTIVVLMFALLATGMDFISAFTAVIAIDQQRRPRTGRGRARDELRLADRPADLDLHAGHVPRPHRAVHVPAAVLADVLAQVAARSQPRM